MWLKPKTDWEIKPPVNGRYMGDWFNVEDYNRIIGNLRYLHTAGQNVYAVVFDILGMTPQDRTGFPRAGEINALEESLYRITINTYAPLDYTGKATWADNGKTPTVNDLNRIERACASIFAKLNETPLKAFHTADGGALVTSDGTFMVR